MICVFRFIGFCVKSLQIILNLGFFLFFAFLFRFLRCLFTAVFLAQKLFLKKFLLFPFLIVIVNAFHAIINYLLNKLFWNFGQFTFFSIFLLWALHFFTYYLFFCSVFLSSFVFLFLFIFSLFRGLFSIFLQLFILNQIVGNLLTIKTLDLLEHFFKN